MFLIVILIILGIYGFIGFGEGVGQAIEESKQKNRRNK